MFSSLCFLFILPSLVYHLRRVYPLAYMSLYSSTLRFIVLLIVVNFNSFACYMIFKLGSLLFNYSYGHVYWPNLFNHYLKITCYILLFIFVLLDTNKLIQSELIYLP